MTESLIALDQLSDEDLLEAALVTMPSTDEEEDESVHFGEVYLPPLPDEATLDYGLASATGGWINTYVDYATCRSPMTPASFHVSAALWLVSTTIARRLVVNLPFDSIYPNMWILWLAPTTLWGKTTALNALLTVAKQVIPHLLLPNESTPEAMLADMAGQEPVNLVSMTTATRDRWEAGRNYPAQRGLVLDEASGLLAAAGRDYNAGLIEAFLRFFDGQDHVRSTRANGWIEVRNSYLSVLSASTPSAMASYLQSPRLWATGWWPRFALLTPETERPLWQKARSADVPSRLVEGLRQLCAALPQAIWPNPPEAHSVELSPDVLSFIDRYSKAFRHDLIDDDLDERLKGTYGRLPTQLVKVATLVAAMDWATGASTAPSVVVELPHLAWALDVVENWRASAHRVLARLDETEQDRLRRRIVSVVERHMPDGASLRDLKKALPKTGDAQLKATIDQLVAEGVLKEVKAGTGPKGGRPTVRYMCRGSGGFGFVQSVAEPDA